MELKRFEQPQFIEELKFKINPEIIEKYLELDYEIFCKGLKQFDGFLGSEIWLSEENEGEVTSLYFWESYDAYKNIDQEWLGNAKQKFGISLGEGNCEFLGAGHEINRRGKLTEYR